MEKVIEIALNGYGAESSGSLNFGTWGSYGNQQIHITPDESWQDLVITAYFRLGDKPSGECLFDSSMTVDIPPKATEKPTSGSVKGKLTFKGVQNGRVIHSTDLPYFVLNRSETEEGDNKYTPDQWTQFVVQAEDSRKAAEKASAEAEKSATQAAQSQAASQQIEGNVILQGNTALQNIQNSLSAATASITSQKNQALADLQEKQDEASASIDEQVSQAQSSASKAFQYAASAESSANAAAASKNEAQETVTSGIQAIGSAVQSGKSEILASQNSAIQAVDASENRAVSAIGNAQQTAVQQVQQAGQESIASAQQSQSAAASSATQAGESASAAASSASVAQQEAKKAASSATQAGESASAAKGSEGAAAASATAAAASEINAENAAGRAEQAAQNSGLPQPTTADAGKVPTVNDAGTSYELRSTLEKNISDYYAMRRTGKVYQTRLWKFAANPTSAGEKLLDNAGLVFEPSTDTEEGQDDYLNGQNPLFEWVNVNYIRDDDGAPRPTAIEGQAGFKTSGAVDVGAMQMSFWYKIDASGEDYIDYYVSDTPHPELGLVPWPECVKADGTVLPWCIGSKYISGEASDGLPRSQPGLKPIRNVSHNSMITAYQQKGPGYWGAGAVRNTFQILFNAIKGATKSSQTLYAGTTSYNFQYAASVQREEKATYFPVTSSQANNIIVGAYVSVGYGSNNNGAVNNDRGIATIHSYADDVKVLRIEDLDENNKAVYLDIEDGFDTMPVALTDSLSAPIMLSSMHWWSGTTDSVRGHHDGSPGSNTNGKYPYRVQGREYAVGGYLVASDTVAWLNEDGTRTVYAAPRGTAHSANTETIQSTYRQIGTIPLNSSGSVADYWVGDAGIDEDTGVWYPSAQGSGSTQGCADMYYCGGDAANSFREYLQCGDLGFGSSAGSCCLNLWYWLGGGYWNCLAGD